MGQPKHKAFMEDEVPKNTDSHFVHRHLGFEDSNLKRRLKAVKVENLEQLVQDCIPQSILSQKPLNLPASLSENELLHCAERLSLKNKNFTSFIGLGYYDTLTPTVILRNIFENPAWYTAYTPYQAEISQGRMEALLNFQTMVSDLTGLEIANASLLDEGTAAAEAMAMAFHGQKKNKRLHFALDAFTFPQTKAVLQTRAEPLGIEIIEFDPSKESPSEHAFAILVQYPNALGEIHNYEPLAQKAQQEDQVMIVCADLLSLTLLKPPGEWGADIVVGSTQRFGVPMGFGGPHAAYLSAKKKFQRQIPGRIIGVSKDIRGEVALRLALQTREQHIRREKATSNICTSQVLLAVMASMYAVYHGPKGLKRIAHSIHSKYQYLRKNLMALGFEIINSTGFDTLALKTEQASELFQKALLANINLGWWNENTLLISVDESKTEKDLENLLRLFGTSQSISLENNTPDINKAQLRISKFLEHKIFNSYHSETEMLRYIHRLQAKDLSLTHSMIPLGSCTMKLNATTEMLPVSLAGFSKLHPFAPQEQTLGYMELIKDLESWLTEITGFDSFSLQPNAGSQGEYAGLLIIRKYHKNRGEDARNICLIPSSAHGTNPASAAMAGMKVKVVNCDDSGNIDLADLKEKIQQHSKELAALMVTYPSTHGVFEENIKEVCQCVHLAGGQVYMDGANLNALVGVAQPGNFGPDVCHLNLHKTFCIPHGGGGPGVGPIGVAKHLSEFLPSHPLQKCGGKNSIGTLSAAPWGSASILPISWGYIAMMGSTGLTKATQVAILNANYIAERLSPYYPILYRGKNNRIAHECILDVRPFKKTANVTVDDIAKRLMDYGFHAPTMSWPVAGTLMIEPTESESLEELDRFCEAMIQIREEISEIEKGTSDAEDNVLKQAPHTIKGLVDESWKHSYSKQKAVYPLDWVKERKFWPAVARVDNAFGDRNLMCLCPSVEDFEDL